MRKLYEGYALPAPILARFYLDWTCPHCGSANVDIDPLDSRQLSWCDGGPSTEDHMRYWLCSDCQKQTLGYDMITAKEDFDYSPEEKEQQRKKQDTGIEQLKHFLSAIEEKTTRSNE